jgi:putative SOS response-associated peptidase YedK
MPVIIESELYDRWLDPGAEEKNLLSMFTPFPDKKILAYPVGIEVNNPKNDNPNCLVEIKEK